MRSEKTAQQSKKRKKKRRLKPAFYITLFLFVFICAMIVFLVFAFKIKTSVDENGNKYNSGVTVVFEGDCRCTEEQIINSANIPVGKNILLFDTSKIEEFIEKTYPYVKNAEIEKKYPSSLIINVSENFEKYALLSNSSFLILDDDFKVLRSSETSENLIILSDFTFDNAIIGEKINIYDPDVKQILTEILDYDVKYNLNLTRINVENVISIEFIIEDKFVVNMGSKQNLDDKMTLLVSTIQQLDHSQEGIIDLSLWTKDKKECVFTKINIEDYLK